MVQAERVPQWLRGTSREFAVASTVLSHFTGVISLSPLSNLWEAWALTLPSHRWQN